MARRSETERRLYSHVRPKSAIAESFRTLRTNINFSAVDWPYKVILATSPGPEDGKSTVITNLGVVMAQAKSRVLIMDCDLRKPVIHKYFNQASIRGLTNLLVQDLRLEDVVYATEVEGLFIIPSGPIPPNPSELLGSAKMVELLEEAAAAFDVVLLDAPPVIAVTDAMVLTPMVDSVLLVLKAGSSRIDMAREARDRLVRAGARSVGVVLNQADIRGGGYYPYHIYYYYGHREKPPGRNPGAREAAH
ncbi:MAG: Tyrosine-protein kinase YwqD [Firmicutes bacterium ADurb.Bin456]|nr:MAG: Tyrosine-protein kinase YwqD [Firmicutes bacterium ADurb.Bin456]